MTSLEHATSAGSHPATDEGRRAYVLRVFDLLLIGLGVSALTVLTVSAFTVTSKAELGVEHLGHGRYLTEAGQHLFSGWGLIGLLALPFALLFAMGWARRRSSYRASLALYLAFAAAFGLLISMAVLAASTWTVVAALGATATMVGSISVWGYTTKRDLSGWGSFLLMGLTGLIGAGILNLVLASSAVALASSLVGVAVFSGFLAYDVQSIKNAYDPALPAEELNKQALWGAMDIYLDVLNLFLDLLRIFEFFGE